MGKSVEVWAQWLERELIDRDAAESGFREANWLLYGYGGFEALSGSYLASTLIFVIHILTLILDRTGFCVNTLTMRFGDKIA
jgi:hypothetical protein